MDTSVLAIQQELISTQYRYWMQSREPAKRESGNSKMSAQLEDDCKTKFKLIKLKLRKTIIRKVAFTS